MSSEKETIALMAEIKRYHESRENRPVSLTLKGGATMVGAITDVNDSIITLKEGFHVFKVAASSVVMFRFYQDPTKREKLE